MEDGAQSRVRYAEREWRRTSRVRKQQVQVPSTAARTVWWQGNRYGILDEDGHSLPLGGRLLPRESESGPCVTRRMMPHIKLGGYR